MRDGFRRYKRRTQLARCDGLVESQLADRDVTTLRLNKLDHRGLFRRVDAREDCVKAAGRRSYETVCLVLHISGFQLGDIAQRRME